MKRRRLAVRGVTVREPDVVAGLVDDGAEGPVVLLVWTLGAAALVTAVVDDVLAVAPL